MIVFGSACDFSLRALGLAQEWIDDQASILWFPNSFHTKVMIGGFVYSGGRRYTKTPFENFKRTAAFYVDSGFYEFKIRFTAEELRRINLNLERSEGGCVCVFESCKAITTDTGFFIPPPFNMMPGLNAAYLTFLRSKGRLHGGRVSDVVFWGKSEKHTLTHFRVVAETMMFLIMGSCGWLANYSFSKMESPRDPYSIDRDFETEQEAR